jgi:acetamidase/formamidase
VLFSVGDVHYAQGEAERCGTAAEMGCTLPVSFDVLKGGRNGAHQFPNI